MAARLTYGFDALCGWCFGFVPAMRQVMADHPTLPVTLALPGLVTGDRIGPYAEMESYIRGASDRLAAVTGRRPSAAFFDLILRPGVRGDSGPPTLVLDSVRRADPGLAPAVAHAMIEAHFEDGRDLNDPATHAAILADHGLAPAMPDLADSAGAERIWAADRAWGIASFPTLIVQVDGRSHMVPSLYGPGQVSDLVGKLAS